MKRTTKILGALLVQTLAFGAGAGSGDAASVTLRRVARLDHAGAIRLAEIAELKGTDALALAGVVIVDDIGSVRPAGNGWLEIDVEQVRRALGAQDGINWGRLELCGSTCAVRGPSPTTNASRDPKSEAPRAEPVVERGTVREQVRRRLVDLFGASEKDVRLTFDARSDEILGLPVAGRTTEIRPLGTSERMPVSVVLYEGDRIVASEKIRVVVKVRRRVCVARAAIARGRTIGPGDVIADEQWMDPNMNVAAPEEAIGSEVRSRVGAGAIVLAQDIEDAVAIERGDQVSVRYLSGSIALRTKARALASGRAGEVIEFETIDTGRKIRARVSGPGLAVVQSEPRPGAARTDEEATP